MISTVSAAAHPSQTTSNQRSGQMSHASTATAPSAPGSPATEVAMTPTGKLLSATGSLTLDPRVHMANAEKRMAELMDELGVPAGTDIDIRSHNNGKFTVNSDHPAGKELEAMLNDGSERELRNALIGAHTGFTLSRIAAASEKARQAVEANPAAADYVYNQVLALGEQLKRTPFDFMWSGGSLSGQFG